MIENIRHLDNKTQEFYKKYITTNDKLVELELCPIASITNKDKHIFNTKFGAIYFSKYRIKQGVIPSIRSAINKEEYLTNLLKYKQPFLSKEVQILKYDIGEKDKILVSTKYGRHKVYSNSLLRGNKPKINSALNKTANFINRCKQHNPNYNYEEVFIKQYNRKDESIIGCPIHGKFKIKNRYLLEGKGCQKCGRDKLKGRYQTSVYKNRNKLHVDTKNSLFYIVNIYNEEENFFKVGVTTQKISKRFSSLNTIYNYSILYKENLLLTDSIDKEREILKNALKYKYIPKNKFGGYTECLSINPIKYLING